MALHVATAEAARLLAASRVPVVAGLGTDIAGARAAIALAERIGASIDHMNSETVLRDVEVMRAAGIMLTTPNEARLRADVLLMIGAGLVEAWPALPERLLVQPPMAQVDAIAAQDEDLAERLGHEHAEEVHQRFLHFLSQRNTRDIAIEF